MARYYLIGWFLFLFLAFSNSHALELEDVLENRTAAQIFPGATRVILDRNKADIATAWKDNTQLGIVYLNADHVNATGYSGKPIYLLIALGNDGVIRSVSLVEHHEPIVLIGIPESRIEAVIDSYIDLDITAVVQDRDRKLPYDAVSGATVTIRVIDDSILRSAIKLARRHGLGGMRPLGQEKSGREIVMISTDDTTRSWAALINNGSITRLTLTTSDVDEAFSQHHGKQRHISRRESSSSEDVFIDLYAAPVSVPGIGRSLLGDAEYRNLVSSLKTSQHAILLAANGTYSFKGSGYVRGGIFDRFVVIQNDNVIRFRDINHKRLRTIAADSAPDFDNVDLFTIPVDAGFNPAEPWQIELLVNRETGPRSKEFVTFMLDYQLPDDYIIQDRAVITDVAGTVTRPASPDEEGEPLWISLWREKTSEIIILSIALLILTWSFFFQGWLVQHPVLQKLFRGGFLIFTLFGIGLYANAQLSIVNIFTLFNALISGFDWSYFLMDPLIFILWGSVAAALLFWGRGAYCGWLCPFGALQELLNKLAKSLKIPQIQVPWALHERLWSLKYIIFLALFGVSLGSLAMAERLSEIEPFKTVIILKFMREWPFVFFAVLVLAIGLFIERFYCRYLCPLGAALAIPARLRMFEWLKRYRQCGNPCQQCGNECMVQAIHPEGHINVNECLYCLHCQQLYYDDHRCPVMVQKRLKKERRESFASAGTSEIAEQIIQDLRKEHETKQ